MDLNNSAFYINRELSWLEFNERVLEEAADKTNPLFERLKFLAITASNLDEFFMVRVSGLMDQKLSKFMGKDPSGLTAKEQLFLINKKTHELIQKQYNCLIRSILPSLEKEGIFYLKYKDLSKEQRDFVKEYFNTTIFPILTPMAIDQSRPFPLLNNKVLNFIIEVEKENAEKHFAIMQVPTVIKRIVQLPSIDESKDEFIFIEDIIAKHISHLFPGYKVIGCYLFRITRNSDFDIAEEEAEDLLNEMEKSIKRRKWGEPVRVELEKAMNKTSRKFLQKMLHLNEEDIYELSGYLDLTVWFSACSMEKYDHLRNEVFKPKPSPEFWNMDIFERIKKGDVLVHHPYEAFDCVIDFVNKAASDPKTLAIKQTLYRVSGNSPIVNALIRAAENGKQVTVLVELKARFDEENNIEWAKMLEKSGCHVVYGLVGLKTHCKICLVVRKEDEGIKRYIHLGTGNYNDNTAKIYTDLGFFTCKETFGSDVSSLFNLLTGYATNINFNKLSVAPTNLRNTFIKYIENEEKNALEGKEALIIAKMNSLVDVNIIQALYRASIAGVKIKLIVRGICCLKTGISNVSENITVCSIIDRFLEHSRIYYFENGGNCKILLSSADLMPRNLDRRVEVAFPIEDNALKERIIDILNVTLSDSCKLRVQMPDGFYERIDRRGKEHIHSQVIFAEMAEEAIQAIIDEENNEVFRPLLKPVNINANSNDSIESD